MITASELRIGNYLNYDTGEGIELTKIDTEDISWAQDKPEDFNKDHSPVLLTAEVLERCGFAW